MPAPVAVRQLAGPDGRWFAQPLAQRLLQEEQCRAIPALTACHGKTGLYMRANSDAPAELSGNMLQRVLRLHREAEVMRGDLTCLETELPLLRESIDLIYLLHAVDVCERPAQLFEELERILTPEGNLMLVGLNPYSLWWLSWRGYRLRALGLGHSRNLLQRAGFEIVKERGLGSIWPWAGARELRKDVGVGAHDPLAPWRAAYLIQARKRRRGLTPIRPPAGAVALTPGMRPG
jgi:SAM-dependent methyltransferase